MPNWCYTKMTINAIGGENIVYLKEFYDKISYFINFSKHGLYNLMSLAEYLDIANNLKERYRGHIVNIFEFKNSIIIDQQDAWVTNANFWYEVIDQLYPGKFQIFFQYSEPNMKLFGTNDPSLLPRYNCYVYISSFDQLIKYPNLWEKNKLFTRYIGEDIKDNHGNPLSRDIYDRGNYLYTELSINVDGDKNAINEALLPLNDYSNISIDEICEDNNIFIHDYEYISIDELNEDILEVSDET